MTALATKMRNRLGTYQPAQRFSGPTPDRDGSKEQVNAWFREEIYSRNAQIHAIKTDRFFRNDDDDRDHIAMIQRQVKRLLREWERYLKFYSERN